MGDQWLGDEQYARKSKGGSKAEEGGEWQKGEKAASRGHNSSYVSQWDTVPPINADFWSQFSCAVMMMMTIVGDNSVQQQHYVLQQLCDPPMSCPVWAENCDEVTQ